MMAKFLPRENFPEGKLVFKPNLSFRESLVMLKGRATRAQGARYRPTFFSPEKRELLIYVSLNRINGLD
jgi:hypothetical protein